MLETRSIWSAVKADKEIDLDFDCCHLSSKLSAGNINRFW